MSVSQTEGCSDGVADTEVQTCEAVLEYNSGDNPFEPEHVPEKIGVLIAGGRQSGLLWPALWSPPPGIMPSIVKVHLQYLPSRPGCVHILRYRQDDNINPLNLVPQDDCKSVFALEQLRLFHDWVQTPALHEFLRSAFSLRDLFYGFWTAPASLRHHHSWTGGLACHSADVALRALDVFTDPNPGQCVFRREEAEVAGIAAWLHDAGKVLSYTVDGYRTERAQALGHELLGLELLRPAIKKLAQHREDLADALATLLLSRTRYACSSLRLQAMDEVLRKADRESAADNRRTG